MILDVGCGSNRRGDVGLDLYPHWTPELGREIDRGDFFVAGDCAFLPFRDRSFDEVLSFHTLEHSDKPLQSIREMCRVSRHLVSIEVPHRLSRWGKFKYHQTSFTQGWFIKASRVLGVHLDRKLVSISPHLPPVGNISVLMDVTKNPLPEERGLLAKLLNL